MLKNIIFELENKLLLNDIRLDEDELDKLLHCEFSEIGSSGRCFLGEDYFKGEGAGKRRLEILEFGIKEISHGKVLSIYKLMDYERKNITLRSSIWIYEDDRWQIYFHQGTVESMEGEKYDKKIYLKKRYLYGDYICRIRGSYICYWN